MNLTVREVIRLYLTHSQVEGVHGPAARYDREKTLGWFVEALGDVEVSALRAYHLTDWIEAHPQWRSLSTRRLRAAAVKAVFRWAADQERIDRNPFRAVRYGESERRPELPDGAYGDLLRAANKCFELALRWLRLTGCRLGELCEATWADVDLVRGLWTIPRHKSRKRSGKSKIVVLIPEAMSLLHLIRPGRAEGVIFTNTRGRPWRKAILGQNLRRMKARLKLTTPATLHGIRHRMATAAIDAGAPILFVAEQLGHADVKITQRTYFHRSDATNEAMREALQKGVTTNP